MNAKMNTIRLTFNNFLIKNTTEDQVSGLKCKIILVYRVKACNKCIYAYFTSKIITKIES